MITKGYTHRLLVTVIALAGLSIAAYGDYLGKLVEYEFGTDFIVFYDGTNQIVKHFAFTVSYNEEFEQANWVSYKLNKEHLENEVCQRVNHFVKDWFIVTGSASSSNYSSSGYEKGHLAPCDDMLWNEIAMDESFLLSNMSPQKRGFNGGVWKRLEGQVQDWAVENEEIYIVVGPVLDKDTFPTLNDEEKVAIPEKFFKVILDYKEPDIKAIGFIMTAENSAAELSTFAFPVDDVEQLTGLDFFPDLPNPVEDMIEADGTYWE